MKKLGVILACVLLIAALAVPALADDATTFTVTPSQTTAYVGDEITFTVSVVGSTECSSLGYMPSYDRSVYQLVGGQPLIADGFVDYNETLGGTAVRFESPTAFNGNIGTFVLKVIAEIPGNTTVKVNTNIKNGSTTIASTVVAGNVTVLCNHTYGDWTLTTAPGCTTAGVETRTCTKCAAAETREVAAIGHNYGAWVLTTAPTCVATGVETRTCANNCGTAETREVPATGIHTFGDWTVSVAATCTVDGLEVRTCSVCSGVETRAIPAIGHNYGAWILTTAPGCTTTGVETSTCANCGNAETRDVDATGHNYGAWVLTTAPGCTTTGVETSTCANCGDAQTREVAATGHIPSATSTITREPTCEQTGLATGNCSVCGIVLSDEVLPALGHEYEEAIVNPTCEVAGSKTYTCKHDATHVVVEEIPAIGHDFELSATVAPTCDVDGSKTYTCKNDATHTKVEVLPSTGHTFDSFTHEENGSTHIGSCACGVVAEPEAHDYTINGDILVAPTTTTEGQQEMLCVCGDKTVVTLPKISGDLDKVPSTGDITGELVMGAMVVVAMFASAAFVCKRRFVK